MSQRSIGCLDGLADWPVRVVRVAAMAGVSVCVRASERARHHLGNGRLVLDRRDDLDGQFGLMSVTSMKSDTRLRHLGPSRSNRRQQPDSIQSRTVASVRKCARWIGRGGHRGRVQVCKKREKGPYPGSTPQTTRVTRRAREKRNTVFSSSRLRLKRNGPALVSRDVQAMETMEMERHSPNHPQARFQPGCGQEKG